MDLRHQAVGAPATQKKEDQGAEAFRLPLETPTQILEARLESAGRRVTVYLRHLPLPERRRHELALSILNQLAHNPGDNSIEAEARGMRILHDLLTQESLPLSVVPGPALHRRHMRPEEMDRRPWVRVFLRLGRPFWNAVAVVSNTTLLEIIRYALIITGLHLMGTDLS